jgi:ectoine hydroxylase-related dioxygenase (phytanoyl-CoA dioxygenase family)
MVAPMPATGAQDGYWLHEHNCRLDDLIAFTQNHTSLVSVPLAHAVQNEVPLYDGTALRIGLTVPEKRNALMAEWGTVLMHGAGIIVIRQAFEDLGIIDAATAHFQAIIAQQQASHTQGGDHFAKPGANDRIWNALQKHCLRDPQGFARYYSNPLIALVCQAWLGTAYQMTAQVNVVNPGGAAQQPHRDYHLGFMNGAQAQRFPAHVHQLSPVLTLQGAVAHSDMPVETGPTLYLPFSQHYASGYLVADRADFRAHFDRHHVQLPLQKGDAVFFNPALLHAAGHNRTSDVRRMANLLQISSAFGRAMETVDRTRMSMALYPALQHLVASGQLSQNHAAHAVAACAEGYAFPTNLDSDPPLGGLAPPSQQTVMLQALQEGWDAPRFDTALQAQATRRAA